MTDPEFDRLQPVEQEGYCDFNNDRKPDDRLADFIAGGRIDSMMMYLSGWMCAARCAFAEGAIHCAMGFERYYLPGNEYPGGSAIFYGRDTEPQTPGTTRWQEVDADTLLPRARQWHQGFVWQMAQ